MKIICSVSKREGIDGTTPDENHDNDSVPTPPKKKRKKRRNKTDYGREFLDCFICHQAVEHKDFFLYCKVCMKAFCNSCNRKGKVVTPFFCLSCWQHVCDDCVTTCSECFVDNCNDRCNTIHECEM